MCQADIGFKRQVGEDEVPSTAVISAIASIRGYDPIQLPPLHSAIDPDALDRLFASFTAAQDGNSMSVTFVYDDRQVTVKGNGTVELAASNANT